MIYYVTLPLLLLLFVVFQHSVVPALFLNSIKVEISLIVILYAGFRLEIIRGVILALLLGFMMDCISGALSGVYSLIYFILFAIAYLIAPRVYGESSGFIILLTAISGLLEGLLMILFNLLIYGTHDFYSTYRFFLPQLIVVSVVSPIFFKFFDRFGLYHGGYARSAKRR